MALFRIIFFLLLLTPPMMFISGCFGDSFLGTMREEEDFIAPFDVVITTEESKRTTYFPITDTGSTASVLAGDDASYSNLPQPDSSNFESYDNYDGTTADIVIDKVSGLWWTKCTATANNTMDTDDNCAGSQTTKLSDPALLEWSKAATTCKNLDYAHHKDWRLPRLPELLTIVNYGYHPSFDPAIFPNTRGDFEVPHYTNRYSVDDRIRYKKETTGGYTAVNPGDPEYTTTAKFIFEDGVYVFNEGYADNYKEDDTGLYTLAYIDYSNSSVPHYIYEDDSGTSFYFDYNAMTHYIYADDTGPNDYFDYNSMTHFIYVNDNGTYSYIDYASQPHYRFDNPGYTADASGDYIYLPLSDTYLNVANYINSNGYYIQLPVSLTYVNVSTALNTNGFYIKLPVSGDYKNVKSEINNNKEFVKVSGDYISIELTKRYNYDPIWGFGYVQNNAGAYIRIFIKNNEDPFYLSGVDYLSGSGPYVRKYTPDIKVDHWVYFGGYWPITAVYPGTRDHYKFNGTKFVVDNITSDGDPVGPFIQEFDFPVGYWTYTSKLMFDSNMNTADHGWIVFFQNGGSFGVNMASYKLKTKEDLTFEKQFVRCVRGGNGDIDDIDY